MEDRYLLVFYAASGVYTVLLCIAAALDIWKYVIPNAITVALVALFVATALLLPFDMGWRDWMSHIGSAAVVFAAGAVLFAFNKMGGGDVKLLTAVAFWAGFQYLSQLLIVVALAGGALAIGLIVLRRVIAGLMIARSEIATLKVPRLLREGEPVPYALAIAPSSIYLGTMLPQLGVELWL